MAKHLESGRAAEKLARVHLERHGLTYLAANYRCRHGELDLIMIDGATLVVVEVRYRRRTSYLAPIDTITPAKCRRIARTAQHFLQSHASQRRRAVRFDVVGLDGPLDNATMNWIRGAFTIDDIE